MLPQRLRNWPWLTLQIIAANVVIILAVASAWYFAFMTQSSVYSDRLMSTFNIEPGSLHAMYVDDVERQLWMSVSLGLVFAVVASVGLAFLIVKPIRSLAKATEELRHGDYSVRSSVESGEVGRLAGTFNSLAVTLESEERRRSQFLADLGHELRTPITSLQGYTEGLEDGVFQANRKYFALIEGELNHLCALTTTIQTMQLNAFGHIDENQASELSVAAHLESAKERWSARLQQRRLSLKLSTPGNLGTEKLAISTRSSRQILDNLLSNMYRYARPGTRCLIEVSRAAQAQQVALGFSNETLDVTEDCLPYLFDRFYRVSRSRTRTQQENSTGLGLSIVRQLCLLHKGNATADLDGSRLVISVYLPLLAVAR
ncbi:MAG: histidine kinase dimerization/phospho-acceptor domain-containing protein [Gammaproteobacteria bacterium]|nr:histidine kinase dimerization/phospho-acceptor domain-containing protein [Gammaproteobacteria bacterium]